MPQRALRSLSLLLAVAVIGRQADAVVRTAENGSQSGDGDSRLEITAEVAGMRGELILVVTNKTGRAQRLTARLDLGTEAEMKPAGMVDLSLPPHERVVRGLKGASPTGSHYILSIYRERRLLLYTHAPLRNYAGVAPSGSLTLLSITSPRETRHPDVARSTPAASAAASAAASNDNFVPPPEIQIEARLLAAEKDGSSFVVAFSLSSPRPISRTTLSVRLGKFSDTKTINIEGMTQVRVDLPETIEEELIRYRLTARDGRLLLEGDLLLSQLMDNDGVLINDIQLDRPGYAAGEVAHLTMLISGRARAGYRIEISARDGQGNTFHRDQRLVVPDQQESLQEFTLPLPDPLTGPVTFEYRLLDAASGLLYDSGDKDIPLSR